MMSTIFGSRPLNTQQTINPATAGNVIDRSRTTKWTVTGGLTMNLGTVDRIQSTVSFNTMYLEGENIAAYNLALGRGGTSVASSTEAPKTIDGQTATSGDRQYITHIFCPQNDSSVILTITGTSAAIYRCYIFNTVWKYDNTEDTHDSLVQLSQGQEMRGAVQYEGLDGTRSSTPPLNGGKYNASFEIQASDEVRWNKRILDLQNFFIENPNFIVAPDTLYFPGRVYEARLTSNLSGTPIGRNLTLGEKMAFTLEER